MVANLQVATDDFFGVLTATEISGSYIGFYYLPTISLTDIAASSGEVVTRLVVPVGAVVTRAVVEVGASAPGTTVIGGIATVRAASGEPDTPSAQLVVDFGTLRTVSALEAPASIAKLTPWVGTKFDGTVVLNPTSGTTVTFTELQTERLLVDLASAQSPSALAEDGLVTTTTPPADLELTVGGARVWFRAGPVPEGFTEDVDITAAVQAQVDATTDDDAEGNASVSVTLTARVPGSLSLTLPEELRFLRTHPVSFPGATTTIVFDEEGIVDVPLPLPDPSAGSTGLTIHRVVATALPTDPGPERVLPPDRPVVSTEAELVLDPARRLVVRLPRGPLGSFERLVGVRLLMAPQADGIEVGGGLLTGTANEPRSPVPDAAFTPVSLPPGPQAWVTMRLPQPVVVGKLLPPAPDDHLWVSIGVPRGSALLALADPAGTASDDRALLRRVGANGLTRPLSTAHHQRTTSGEIPDPVAADTIALRVVGIPPAAAPVPVVTIDAVGGGTTTQPGLAGSLAITLTPAQVRSPLQLRLTATAATSVTVGPVVVAYTDSSQP
jgi:hypothetical protein